MIPTFVSVEELWSKKALSNIGRRIKATIKFIDKLPEPIADAGESNPLALAIEKELHRHIESITWDFDTEQYTGKKYGTVFCFEIIEHLFNPLAFLLELKKALKPDGVIYLSVPGRPRFLWGPHHYHEPDNKRLGWLFERAGLEVVKTGYAPTGGKLRYHLLGVRLFLRYFCKTRLFKLRVKE